MEPLDGLPAPPSPTPAGGQGEGHGERSGDAAPPTGPTGPRRAALEHLVPSPSDRVHQTLAIDAHGLPEGATAGVGRWARLGSNQRPRDYESPALTTELRAPSETTW